MQDMKDRAWQQEKMLIKVIVKLKEFRPIRPSQASSMCILARAY